MNGYKSISGYLAIKFFSGGQAPQTPEGSLATLAPRLPQLNLILVKLCAHGDYEYFFFKYYYQQ